jgi:hypothetical protein
MLTFEFRTLLALCPCTGKDRRQGKASTLNGANATPRIVCRQGQWMQGNSPQQREAETKASGSLPE